MKKWLFLSAFAVVVGVSACGKKDEGGGGPVGCAPGTYAAPWYGGMCLPKGQCPRGTLQSPTQPSMCADMNTGDTVMQQQCGAGYFLTAQGCLPRGACPQGQAQVGDHCIDVISGSTGVYQQQQLPTTGMFTGMYSSPYGGMPMNTMQPNPFGFGYRGF